MSNVTSLYSSTNQPITTTPTATPSTAKSTTIAVVHIDKQYSLFGLGDKASVELYNVIWVTSAIVLGVGIAIMVMIGATHFVLRLRRRMKHEHYTPDNTSLDDIGEFDQALTLRSIKIQQDFSDFDVGSVSMQPIDDFLNDNMGYETDDVEDAMPGSRRPSSTFGTSFRDRSEHHQQHRKGSDRGSTSSSSVRNKSGRDSKKLRSTGKTSDRHSSAAGKLLTTDNHHSARTANSSGDRGHRRTSDEGGFNGRLLSPTSPPKEQTVAIISSDMRSDATASRSNPTSRATPHRPVRF